MARVVVRKSGSVRQEKPHDIVTRFSSVRDNGSRDNYCGSMPFDAANYPMLKVGATGSVAALMDRDVRSRCDFRSVAERPANQETSWSDRWWLLRGRRQSSRSTVTVSDRNRKDGDKYIRNLEAVDEKYGKIPKWKRLLRKFKGQAIEKNGYKTKAYQHDSHATAQEKVHPSYGEQRNDGRQIQYDFLQDKQEIKKGVRLQGDRQKPLTFFEPLPLPLPTTREHPQISIWERRK
eukprot:c16465_g1_i1 orf=3-701(-)